MTAALFLIPLAAGLAAFFLRSDPGRRVLLIATALVHSTLTAFAWWRWSGSSEHIPAGSWIALDALGLLFLSIVSALFLASALYGVGFLGEERRVRHIDFEEHLYFSNESEAMFSGFMLLFLASMTLVTVSQHFGLLW